MIADRTDREGDELVAAIGEAKLIRDREGKHRMVGGTKAERAELKVWIAKFMADIRVDGR